MVHSNPAGDLLGAMHLGLAPHGASSFRQSERNNPLDPGHPDFACRSSFLACLFCIDLGAVSPVAAQGHALEVQRADCGAQAKPKDRRALSEHVHAEKNVLCVHPNRLDRAELLSDLNDCIQDESVHDLRWVLAAILTSYV